MKKKKKVQIVHIQSGEQVIYVGGEFYRQTTTQYGERKKYHQDYIKTLQQLMLADIASVQEYSISEESEFWGNVSDYEHITVPKTFKELKPYLLKE